MTPGSQTTRASEAAPLYDVADALYEGYLESKWVLLPQQQQVGATATAAVGGSVLLPQQQSRWLSQGGEGVQARGGGISVENCYCYCYCYLSRAT